MEAAIDFKRCIWLPLAGFAELEPVSAQDCGTAQLYAWGRLVGGASVLWRCDLTQPPGQMQRWTVIDRT